MPDSQFKPATASSLRHLRDKLDAAGLKLVFTNGCFDLLHVGHVRYLEQAAALGDALVVALNSDASVRALKGPDRPLNAEMDRAEVLAALRCVQGVIVFEEPRVTSLINQIRPHIYAKGGDYTPESLDPEERAALDEIGAAIHILPLVPGRSTTRMIAKMQPPPPQDEQTTPRLRLAVLGSCDGSNLQALIDAIAAEELHAEISLAITDEPASGFLAKARAADLPSAVIDAGTDALRTRPETQLQIHALLSAAEVDVVVLAGFMRVLKNPVIEAFRDRIVNVHPSLLPKYKGRDAVRMAIEEGELETGCTVHLVTAEIDSGRVLAQASVPVEVGDTVEELHARIKVQEHRLLPRVLNEWRERGLPTSAAAV